MVKIGFVPSHRSPFNKEWAIEMRNRVIKSINKSLTEIELIYPDDKLTDGGLVTFEKDAEKVIDLFKQKKIEGLLIGMMTFGEELPNLTIADAFDKLPMQIFGTREGPFTEDGNRKSDSFCGTISTASGLIRRNIKFDFAGIYFPEEEEFISDLKRFSRVVLACNGFIGARIGILGSRPAPFETCAINEVDLIERFKQRVVPFDLITLKAEIDSKTADPELDLIIENIKNQYDTSLVNIEQIIKTAKMEYFLTKYALENKLSGFGIQCWTAMQEQIGISPCLSMGRLTNKGIMTSCEVDVHGTLTMLVQHLLSFKKTVPHFIDWTIQNQEDENTFLAWHCGNAPISLKYGNSKPRIDSHSILGCLLGFDRSVGTAEFQLQNGIVTLSRLVEINGKFKMLNVTGEGVYDPRTLRGSWKWIKVQDLKKLYRTIIEEGFTHHASMIFGDISKEMKTFCKFMDIEYVTL